MTAPGRRSFQFTASSPREAREWVDQINFVLKDLSSSSIPYDEDEEEEVEEEGEETYDDIEGVTGVTSPRPAPGLIHELASRNVQEDWRSRRQDGEDKVEEEEDDIYEKLPDSDITDSIEDATEKNGKTGFMDYANYYQGLWDCEPDEPDELQFQRGDLIYVVSKEYNIHGWWVGELNGTVGIVPKDFLQPAYIL